MHRLELIGITAAEAANPEKTIPRATNQALYRVLIFYVGALFILLSLFPWQKVVSGGSPFVLIFAALESNAVATISLSATGSRKAPKAECWL